MKKEEPGFHPAYEKELFANKCISLSDTTITPKCDKTMINKLRLNEEYEQIMYNNRRMNK